LEIDNDNQTLNYKLRKHILAKSPLIVIIGRNEELNNTVTVRRSGSDEQRTLSVDDFLDEIRKEIIK